MVILLQDDVSSSKLIIYSYSVRRTHFTTRKSSIDETNEYLSMNTRTHTTTLNDSCLVHAELEGTGCRCRRLWAMSTIRSIEDSTLKFGRGPTNVLCGPEVYSSGLRGKLSAYIVHFLSRHESNSSHSVVENGVMRRGRRFRTPRHRYCPHTRRTYYSSP